MALAKEDDASILESRAIRNGLAALERSSQQYEKTLVRATNGDGAALARASRSDGQHPVDGRGSRNDARRMASRIARGTENQIYAPGFYTGYEVKTLPGVRESIEQKRGN